MRSAREGVKGSHKMRIHRVKQEGKTIISEKTKLTIELDENETLLLERICEKTGTCKREALQQAVSNYLKKGTDHV